MDRFNDLQKQGFMKASRAPSVVYESATYTLEIYGVIWTGARAVYSYTIPAPISTDDEAKHHAGDFAAILDWRVVESKYAYERRGALTQRIDNHRTLRGFRNGMTPRRFYALANRVTP